MTDLKDVLQSKNQNKNAERESELLPDDNIWKDSKRIAKFKLKSPDSLLILNTTGNKNEDENNVRIVENVVIEKNIKIDKSFNDKEGNLVVVCSSEVARQKLKQEVEGHKICCKSPKAKSTVISIVGMKKEVSLDEAFKTFQLQNEFLSTDLSVGITARDFNIFAIKPVKSNDTVFQAFVRVSVPLRKLIKANGDRMLFGLSSCRVYDQFHIKRCNKCQQFGHYIKYCTASNFTCASCSGSHDTRSCKNVVKRCVNCQSDSVSSEECKHAADSLECPTLLKAKSKAKENLNLLLNKQ